MGRWLSCFLFWISFSLCSVVHADLPPGVRSAPLHSVDNAVSVLLSPKGEQYFSDNLESVLGNMGISIREGFFPQMGFTADHPMTFVELLRNAQPETVASVNSVVELLEKMFLLPIENPQPDLQLKNFGYRISYKKHSLSFDRNILRKLGRKTGTVLVLDLEIDHFSLGGQTIELRDLNNRFFGVLGVESPNLFLKPGSKNLRLKIPLYLDVPPGRNIVAEGFPMQSNFSESEIDFEYADLRIPKLTITFDDGKPYTRQKNYVIQLFEEAKPRILEQARKMIDRLATETIPQMVAQKLQQTQPDDLNQLNKMRPPAMPDESVDPDFLWGLGIHRIFTGDQGIGVELKGFVADPVNANVPINAEAGARGPVSFTGGDPRQYDVAVAINRGLINRFLQLSYHRGYLKEVSSNDGDKLKFFAPPLIDAWLPDAGVNTREPRLKIKVAVSSPVKGLKGGLFKGDARFVINLVGRLVEGRDGEGFRVQLDAVDGSSLVVMKDCLTWLGQKLFDQVQKGILETLQKSASGWKKTPMILPGDIPLNLAIFGQNLVSQSMRMDKNGYLVMFLNFEGAH